jgi:hypothetical protein
MGALKYVVNFAENLAHSHQKWQHTNMNPFLKLLEPNVINNFQQIIDGHVNNPLHCELLQTCKVDDITITC